MWLGEGRLPSYSASVPYYPQSLTQVTKVNNFFCAHQLYAHTDRHWLMMEMKMMTGLKEDLDYPLIYPFF